MNVPNRKTRRKKSWKAGAVAMLCGMLIASMTVTPASAHPGGPGVPSGMPSGVVDWLKELKKELFVQFHMLTMDTEEKVGQLFVTYAYGETADTTDPADVAANQADHGVDNGAELLETYNLGGVIYFAWSNNVNNPEQIVGLSNGLQQAAKDSVGTPLLISTDQEHGIVTRIGPPATQFPGAMAIGATFNSDLAYEAANISGQELRALGINQNFAPVADVNVNPDNPVIGVRSYSSNPQHASDMVAAQVNGYLTDGNVSPTVKHFPGHGDTDVDSHLGLPVITHTYEEWQQLDAPPFAAAIDAGVETVMTAHIQFPALDPSLRPATLSEPILTGLLRDELGYDGVVITDSLQMEGIRTEYGDDRVPVMALLAGADMLLMPMDIEVAYNAVLEAVDTGEISRHRLNQSVARILRLKYSMGLFEGTYTDPEKIDECVGIPAHLDSAQHISDQSTTLLTNDGTLPVADTAGDVFVTGWGATTVPMMAGHFTDRGWNATSATTGPAPTPEEIEAAVEAAEGSDLIVVTTNNPRANPSQAELTAALYDTGIPVVAVAVQNPYDIAHYTDTVAASIATYSYGAAGIESAVSVILGEIAPQGQLPVDIFQADSDEILFEFGHGLTY